MGRHVRTWFEGAKFHVTSRGIRKSNLFFEEEDYERYLSMLEEIQAATPFILQSYCLMTNHTHLQLTTQETPLSTIMKNLNTKYAKYFNKKYQFTGHVFEKRYGAELLNSPEYELEVSKYIHLNPVKAGMVKSPEDYPWSSYSAFNDRVPSSIIQPESLLTFFPEPASFYYQQYMQTRPTDKFYWENGKFIFKMEEAPCGLK